jgi:predicted RNA-binding Zn ribbon-like protein
MVAAWVPPDWLSDRGDAPASDLDLAVVLLNTLDLLEDPADRLQDLAWWRDALRQLGHPGLAAAQRRAQLPRLRELRETLRAVFECDEDADAAALLNPALVEAGAVVQLGPEGLGVTATARDGGLAARLLAAVAAHVASHGVARLGSCHSDPCRCAYVDRTRAGTRRYCCSVCNDRAAARAYRRRRARTGS